MILVPLATEPAPGDIDVFPGGLALDWTPGALTSSPWAAAALVLADQSAGALTLNAWTAGRLYLDEE